MNKITLGDRCFELFIPHSEIDKAIAEVAQAINREYENNCLMLLITLNGAIVFAADLLKQLTVDCRISCIKLSSYSGTECTHTIKDLIGLTEDLTNQRVLIIEDIVDTGNTYAYIVDILKNQNVKDIKIATMIFKPDAYKHSLPVHFVGLPIPDKFIVGRGLDYNGTGRNLIDIYQVCE
ncbi:MAG: hypoxanthine phosphoribosyltransferase [Bacteroidales bacterium]|jgi:hypoxanthine phosphoribosyltransferase|nr:hypoxanthine phosphoribosyltransferase [Bacteroidales bacterium]